MEGLWLLLFVAPLLIASEVVGLRIIKAELSQRDDLKRSFGQVLDSRTLGEAPLPHQGPGFCTISLAAAMAWGADVIGRAGLCPLRALWSVIQV